MIMAYGTSTVELQAHIGNRTSIITLRNVLYTPDAIHNLFSLTCLDQDGGSSLSGGGQTRLYDKNKTLFAVATLHNGGYELRMHKHLPVTCMYQAHTWNDWHRCFGHVGVKGLQCLHHKNLVNGLTVVPSPLVDGPACIEAKQSKTPFPLMSEPRTTQPGELIHTDVWGPAQTEALSGRVC